MEYIFSISKVHYLFKNANSSRYKPSELTMNQYKDLIKERSSTIQKEHYYFLITGKKKSNAMSSYFDEILTCYRRECTRKSVLLAHIQMYSTRKIYIVPFCKKCNGCSTRFSLKTRVPLIYESNRKVSQYCERLIYLYFKNNTDSTYIPIKLTIAA